MITEVFLEGNRVDISADISSLLTFALDDVKDFSVRQTTFSKTIVLPGTANNNALFGNIFDTGSSNDYDSIVDNIGYNFNALKSARCLIFQDNLQTFKGSLRLLQINKDRGSIDYEVAINGELTNLNVALSSGFLSDLDFSAYDQAWNETNIVNSWDNTPGSGVYFPLIDYGTYSVLKASWDYRTMRPALYAKEYIDKMFTASGYRYECDLFNTARFKGLVVPNNTKDLFTLSSMILDARKTTSQTVLSGGSTAIGTWPTYTGGGFSYFGGTFTYTGGTTLSTTLSWRLGGYRYSSTAGSFRVSIRKNGVALTSSTIATFGFTVVWSYFGSITTTINTGDTFDVYFEYISGASMLVTFYDVDAYFKINSTVSVYLPVSYNQTITMNDTIPKNIRQIDFLLSIVKLFNLYVYESQFDENLILIKPFIDFYSTDSSNAVDWTYKLNRDSPIKIKPLSEINSKIYNFNYKSDGDFYNDLYAKRYNQSYGSYTFDSEFEFVSQTNSLELIFSPTPLVGYSGEDKVYSTIFKQSGTTEECIDSNIRLLQTKKITGITSWDIKNGGSVLTSVTKYGYAGHFDDPDNPSNDLNFGVLKELFFILTIGDLTVTQFNVYWSAYMSEITDKDSKMLTGKFYLTPKDIFSLDFSKYVVVDGVLFRLNKIIDYNASIPSDCEVELLKVIQTLY